MVTSISTQIPGRARFHIKGLYRSASIGNSLERGLKKRSGVIHICANSLTGKALVLYDQRLLDLKVLTTHIEEILTNPEKIEDTEYPDHSGDFRNLPWHALSMEAVFQRLGLIKDLQKGLSEYEVKRRQIIHGPNSLPVPEKRSDLSIFLGQFKTLPVYMLIGAASFSLFTAGIADALIILAVVGINATVGFFTERQAERTLESLKSISSSHALLIRDGEEQEIPEAAVVPGDLMVLRPGHFVPADGRILEAANLFIDESAITGESEPVEKFYWAIMKSNTAVADRMNMVYRGTLVTGGKGVAITIATGKSSEVGKIQSLIMDIKAPETPLERQLDHMGRQITTIAAVLCGGIFVIGLLRGLGLLEMLTSSISLSVAAIPEGLPAIATTTLAIGIQKMRRHKVIIRHLEAIETLGSVRVLCVDKTGTLTCNRMTVGEIYCDSRLFEVNEKGLRYEGEMVSGDKYQGLKRLLTAGVLCSEVNLLDVSEDGLQLEGSPTEKALIIAAWKGGINVPATRSAHTGISLEYRTEGRNWMRSVHLYRGRRWVFVKGAPREVMDLCDRLLVDGWIRKFGNEDKKKIADQNEKMACKGMRVLGFAYRSFVQADEDVNGSGLIWLGLVGIIDPLRDGVADVIRTFHSAGIRTVMITGDQGMTAAAIGKKLRLNPEPEEEPLEVLEAQQLAGMDPEVLRGLASRLHIFARVSPAHKLRIVKAIQSSGEVVSMTGDGINDGPALKAADVGVAMGGQGSDVAREVADVILEDDNLGSMVEAISSGRTIYTNIRKSLHFLLSTNFSEVLMMFGSVALGLGQPLNPLQLLWINLISDIFPGLALAMEPPEPDVMKRPPRDPAEPILTRHSITIIGRESLILTAGGMAAYGWGIYRYGIGPRAGSIAFATLASGQLIHSLGCRSEYNTIFDKEKLPANPYLNGALGLTLGFQVFALTFPPLRSLLRVSPIGLLDGVVVAGGAIAPLLINESIKATTRKTLPLNRKEEMRCPDMPFSHQNP